eukprot:CAMPEP_0196580420 /NCGR_PEP_ID=MMETSP1081-20130531/28618_1 /TAXON_ID=36882 /ORGANISM="Pyramimonas amylifera, Strain CCMP720" /LENGTH=317 /DNA_ID=CAMNT_0041900281 /DNA_START=118 /DNA_END=1071 /DNA_ORIENTATION=+
MPSQDLSGQVAIVTGSNTGVGKETATALCEMGAHVVMACRTIDRARPVAEAISSKCRGTAEAMQLDLADLKSVQEFANAFLAKHKKLHILVNNGGLNTDGNYKGPKTTKQGYEICFGTNFLGHFVLTMMLLDLMKKTGKPARIVNVSSVTVWFASIKFENYYKGPAKTQGNYAASKMASTVFGKELARKLADAAVVVESDPGFVASDIWRNSPIMKHVSAFLALTPRQGARTSIEAATSTSVKTGDYLVPFSFKFSSIMKLNGSFGYNIGMPLLSKLFHGCTADKTAPKAYKPEAAKSLFDLAYKICEEEGINLPQL